MRDVLQRARPARRYGEDRSNGACIIYADASDPTSGRVWPRAIPAHLSPCRVDAGKGLRQHRCSSSHADVVSGYRAWRDHEYSAADHVTGTHMSSDDALRWVVLHWPTVVPYITDSPACEVCDYRGGHWHYCPRNARRANRELWTDVP